MDIGGLLQDKNKGNMIFYHGTTEENWHKIQEEGILYGRRFIVDKQGHPIKEVSRCTYLVLDLEEAKQYGEVVLEIEYNPFDDKGNIRKNKIGSRTLPTNNYTPDCWQVRVYEPISIEQVKRIQ